MKFLQGTYGFDILSIFLLLISMLFSFNRYTNLIGLFISIFVIYRAFSKDKYRRSMELSKFTIIANRLLGKFGKKLPNFPPPVSLDKFTILFYQIKLFLKEKKDFKIIKCPNCNQKLRVPRGKGNIIITCKKCSNKFDAKS